MRLLLPSECCLYISFISCITNHVTSVAIKCRKLNSRKYCTVCYSSRMAGSCCAQHTGVGFIDRGRTISFTARETEGQPRIYRRKQDLICIPHYSCLNSKQSQWPPSAGSCYLEALYKQNSVFDDTSENIASFHVFYAIQSMQWSLT